MNIDISKSGLANVTANLIIMTTVCDYTEALVLRKIKGKCEYLQPGWFSTLRSENAGQFFSELRSLPKS